MHKKRILVAALNWGLGHATRCIPLIWELEKEGFIPLIASDGPALLLLQKEFPHLKSFALPSYNIEYAAKPAFLKWKLLLRSPKILAAIEAENNMTKEIVEAENISGIISDNRFGVRYKYVRSVFITHQLQVLSGNTTYWSSTLHQKYLRKFDECWVPDYPDQKNLSGVLGHLKNKNENIKYIGPLSRFEKKEIPLIYDILLLLSGPEPQRSILENILIKEFEETSKKILLVRGVLDEKSFSCTSSNISVKNYLLADALQETINSSQLIISRSGYSTIMDLSKLEKKAFFIPTPGQYEQEYLAERLMKLGIAPFCAQKNFSISRLKDLGDYSGLKDLGSPVHPREFFSFFKSE